MSVTVHKLAGLPWKRKLPIIQSDAEFRAGDFRLFLAAVPRLERSSRVAALDVYGLEAYWESQCCEAELYLDRTSFPTSGKTYSLISCSRCYQTQEANLSFLPDKAGPLAVVAERPWQLTVEDPEQETGLIAKVGKEFLWKDLSSADFFRDALGFFSDLTDWERYIEAANLELEFWGAVAELEAQVAIEEKKQVGSIRRRARKLGLILEDTPWTKN